MMLFAVLAATTATRPAGVDFARDVRPILEARCHACHGPDKQKSGLRLDVRAAAFKGGDGHGPAVVPGKPADSPLVRSVNGTDKDLVMPPKGPRLTPAEVATLTRWVEAGADWPASADRATLPDRRDHWAFRPVRRPPVPADVRHPIDAFVLARLAEKGLAPNPPADRAAWLRRVTFDLTGLPPTPEDVAAFLADPSPDAFGTVVDRLLASPRYGERQAQHWLDVVRYADTHGFEVNTERPHAWPYRDYVIKAFNADVPYDRFVREQVAGDRLGEDAATGFLVTASVLLPGQIGADPPSMRLARQDALDEIVVNTSQTFLGLSLGCARCHDHKFDPLTQRDYHALQAVFAGVEYDDRPVRGPGADARRAAAAARVARLADPSLPAAGRAAVLGRLRGADAGLTAFAGTFRTPDVVRLLHRGDPEQPRDEVAPAVPAVLGSLVLPKDAPEADRRAALAGWLTDPANPLTARVMVNRVWQTHFGTGLVETPSDFGRSGAAPSHPELLDWLATEFVRGGWSVKHLHRLIVLSATYRQSARVDPAALKTDADARLLWRFPSRRLEGEAVRDAMLAVSGRLNFKEGGPGFDVWNLRGGLTGFVPVESFAAAGRRRMIYAHRVRRERDPVFGALDCPDNGQSAARRRESTTPVQALNLLNSRFAVEEAGAFAARVRKDAGPDVAAQVRRAYRLALGRDPEASEAADAEAVVADHGAAALCRALFNCNEFVTLP